MTDSGLSAVFLVAIVLLAVVSGGTTYALFSDTESVTVSVEIDTVPADPVKTDGTSNRTTVQLFTCPGPAEALSDGANSSATNASGAPAANETASNGTESDGTVCPRQPGDGPRPLGSTDGNTTNSTDGNATGSDGLNETTIDDNESVADGNETASGDNVTETNGTETNTDSDASTESNTGDESDSDDGSDTETQADVATVGWTA